MWVQQWKRYSVTLHKQTEKQLAPKTTKLNKDVAVNKFSFVESVDILILQTDL